MDLPKQINVHSSIFQIWLQRRDELEILEEIIQQNYIKIIEDVNAILKKIEDKLKEKSAVPAAGTHKTEQKIIR